MTHLKSARLAQPLQSSDGLSFRDIHDQDLCFLRQLYATTRASEMAILPWGEQQKEAFLEMQFNAQHTFYQQQFKQAKFSIVVKNNVDIGRLYIDQRAEEIRIIDIALLPAFQRMGIGKKLLLNVMHQAQQSHIPVTIHVEKNNPAMSLYQHLGFKIIEDQGVYNLMRWQ